jgi:hypothetical protein
VLDVPFKAAKANYMWEKNKQQFMNWITWILISMSLVWDRVMKDHVWHDAHTIQGKHCGWFGNKLMAKASISLGPRLFWRGLSNVRRTW